MIGGDLALPVKDYEIEYVSNYMQSSCQFTPVDHPRVTQTKPIQYEEGEAPTSYQIPRLHQKILDNTMFQLKYAWVPRPGENDFFIHKMYKKYTFPSENYDPRYMNRERIFNRSYQYELDCVEDKRLQKLDLKNKRDEAIYEGNYQRLVKKQHEKEPPAINIVPCAQEPPGWWQLPPEIEPEPEEFTLERPSEFRARWQEEPNLTAFVKDDPCQRKKDMLLVGRPFKSEACLWYLKTYPTPKINFRFKRFA